MDPQSSLLLLKKQLEKLTGLPPATQKLMKGTMLKDDNASLSLLGIKDGVKLMLIGTKICDVIAVNTIPDSSSSSSSFSASEKKEPLSLQDAHKKIIEKGLPEDAEPGDKTKKLPVPKVIKGIHSKTGQVRLTFKTDVDELWIASATYTQKLPFQTISSVTSEPIVGQENYHIMALQIGSSENSKYWLYFIPAQYVDSIKDQIMGGFPF